MTETFASEYQQAAQPGGKNHMVFVYGTLKNGYGNHHYHLGKGAKGEAEFIGYGKTKGSFVMFHTGGYPMVAAFPVTGAQTAPVAGELYAIDDECLRGLDRLEGNGSLFIRNLYDIELLDGSVVPAFMYTGVQAHWQVFANTRQPLVPNELGQLDWNPYKGKRNAA